MVGGIGSVSIGSASHIRTIVYRVTKGSFRVKNLPIERTTKSLLGQKETCPLTKYIILGFLT